MATPLKMNDSAKAREFFADKMAFTTGPIEVSNNIKQHTDFVIVDVREAEDYVKGHVPGALNLPFSRWQSLEGLDRRRLNVLYCYSQQCHLAAMAAVEFAGKGFSVMEMDGGFEVWTENGLDTERGDLQRRNQPMAVSA